MKLAWKSAACSAAFLCTATLVQARDGDIDVDFGNGGVASVLVERGGEAYAVAVQGDGKIVLGGGANADPIDELEAFALVRFLPNGQLDASFGDAGTVVTVLDERRDGAARGVFVQPDGNVVAAGWVERTEFNDQFGVFRHRENGTLDSTFGTGGMVFTPVNNDARAHALALQEDGKIVLAGWTETGEDRTEVSLVRYGSDGALDPRFGDGGTVATRIGPRSEALAVAIQSDGKIVVTGAVSHSDLIDEQDSVLVARYMPDGVLDVGFGDGGIVVTSAAGLRDSAASALLLQADGRIVVAGYIEQEGHEDFDFYLLRYDNDGRLDTSFGDGGAVVTSLGQFTSSVATAVVVQSDGKLVAAGAVEGEFYDQIGVVRYDTTGNLDTRFGAEGIARTALGDPMRGFAAALYGEDKLVVAGVVEVGAFEREEFLVARYVLTSAPCACDCAGDAIVTVDELVTAVNIALGLSGRQTCPPADTNGDGQVTVDELISGVNAALSGC